MTPVAPWLRSLPSLVSADLRRRYAGSALGAAWGILSPLVEVAIYGIVFGLLLGVAARSEMPYALLIATGIFPWASFREALEGSGNVLPDNRWVRRARVPRELLVGRLVAVAMIRSLVAVVVVIGYAAWTGSRPGPLAWCAPFLALAAQALMTFGLGLAVAPLAVILPDLRPTLSSILTLLTFGSPILFPESLARGGVALVLLCNPFTHLLRLYRAPVAPLSWADGVVSSVVVVFSVAVALGAGRFVSERAWWRARDAL